MTTRSNGDQDHGTPEQPAENKREVEARAELTDGANPEDRRRSQRRRPEDGLGIGAPLTAAFIGGFLIIENLAGADQPDGDGTAILPEDMLSLDAEGGTWSDDPSGNGQSAEVTGANSGDGLNPADPGAAPSEDVSAGTADAGGGAAAAMAMVETGFDGTAMPEDEGGNGGAASLNFFNINFGDGETGSVEAIPEDDVISRNRQVGTEGDDVLTGTDGDDAISGGEGDDIITGLGGSDILNGNGGDDQLFGGTGRDFLDGGSGNDVLDGGADDDLDLLRGGAGDDVIFINSHVDVALERDFGAYADDDDLVVVRESYADNLPNGEQSSTFVFADNLGSSLPSGASGYRQLLSNGIENVRLEGTADHDIFADGLDNRLTGNSGNNVIAGGAGNDQLSGGGGGDRLDGGDGDDEIKGGSGDDVIAGGAGEDMLYGDAGDDVFVVGLNDGAIDTIFDHDGANRLVLDGVTDETVGASLLGDDLFVTVDDTPVVRLSDYVGNEGAFSGIDFGQGQQSFDDLLTDHQDLAGALDEAAAQQAEADASDILSAHLHLSEPTITGDPRADQRLDGTETDDWLSGFDGKDVLFGHDGNDILEGGDGSDQLRGGAGDDRYLFSSGENGIDVISDSEGQNLAELKGFDQADIQGTMFGDDLRVLADGDLLFSVEDFASNPESFQGVQVGQRMIQTEDLFA